jgi:small-conductance mechanosensitive channel
MAMNMNSLQSLTQNLILMGHADRIEGARRRRAVVDRPPVDPLWGRLDDTRLAQATHRSDHRNVRRVDGVGNTPDNIRTFIGNNKVFSDTIQNFSANPYRRVDLVAQLHGSVDHNAAIRLLKERLGKIANVKTDPAPVVEIQEFTAFGPLLAVRPFCDNKDYWQVYFDTKRMIREAFGEAGFPPPEQRVFVRPAA